MSRRINPLKNGINLKSRLTPKSGFPSTKIPTCTAVTIKAAIIKKRKENKRIAHIGKCMKP